MRSNLLFALATSLALTIILTVLPSLAQTEQSTDTVKLAYTFTPGQTLRYKVTQRLAGTRNISGSSAPTRIDMELNSVIRMRCTKALEDGTYEVTADTEVESLKVGGQLIVGYKSSQGTRTHHLSRTGKVIPGRDSAARTAQTGVDFGNVESIVLMAIMPDTPVTLGGTWSAELPLPVDAASRLKLDFRLQEIKGGAAYIGQTLSTPSQRSAESVGGSQSGQVSLVFDMTRGRLISARGAIRSQVVSPINVPTPPGAQSPGGSRMATLDVNSDYTVELLPALTEQTKPVGG